jgi:hypothetical protein
MKLKGARHGARRVKRLSALFCRHCAEPSTSAKALVKQPIFQHPDNPGLFDDPKDREMPNRE